MRLIGYAVRRRPFFRAGLYLPLGDLTVLLGANDTGKSTLLRSLGADLEGPALEELDGQGYAFYAEVSDAELPLLSNRREAVTAERGIFDAWAHGGYDASRTPDREPGEETIDAHLRVLRATATSEGFGPVIDALSASRVVCLEPPGVTSLGWSVHWCLPPLADLDPDVRAALERSELHRFMRARAEASGEQFRRPDRIGGRPARWIEDAGAPVAVAPLGGFPLPVPRPLAVPAGSDTLRATVVESLISTANVARWALHDAWGYEFTEADEARRSGAKVLLEAAGDGAVGVAPVVVGAVRLIAAAAAERLPGFVSARYRLDVGLRPIADWFDGSPLELALQPTGDPTPAARFELDAVADGLKLWLQLALLFGVDQLEQAQTVLRDLAHLDFHEEWLVPDDGSAGESPPAANHFGNALDALAAFGDGDGDGSGGAGADLRAELGEPAAAGPHRPELPGRVLLADEPERHLNPRLQRRAARWLAELAAEGHSPCVVASHSNAFLSLPPGAKMVHVRRGERGIEVQAFDPVAIDELDAVAAELGFDRGELLVGISCFLLVEGEHEIAVLEAIFGRDLAEARVLLVPLRGSPPKGLLEVDALWRFTTAAVAVCLDNVRPDAVARAQDGDDEALRELRRSTSSEEEKALARLITQSRRHARPIVLLGHPGIDLIDALDPDAVRAVYPDYPASHDLAQGAYEEAVAAARERGEAKPQRKPFLEQRYGVENSRRTYERVGAAHRERGLRPPDLERIVEHAARAAAAADSAALGLAPPTSVDETGRREPAGAAREREADQGGVAF